MRYKTGDIVKIKDDLSIEKYDGQSEQGIVKDMIKYRGQIAKVILANPKEENYVLDIDDGKWAWEDLVLEDVKCYKPTFDKEIVEQFLRNVNVDYTEYKEEIIGDISYNAIKSLFMENTKLQQENSELKQEISELKNSLSWRINYCQELEKDLFENCNNYVIPIQKVKDKIEEILNNGEYRIIFEGDAEFPDEATRIDAQKYIKLEKLQELLEGRKENESN